MLHDQIPPRRGPEPICFQPLLPLENPDDHTPLADFILDNLLGLIALWIAASVVLVLALGAHS